MLKQQSDAIAAALTAVVFFLPVLATPEAFWGSGTDLPRMEYPFHVFATSWMAQGVLPLWNPFIFGGVPFQAGIHGYLYPGWATGALLPPVFDFKLGILLHLILGAVGGVWFARVRVRSRLACYLAGITFALSGFSVMQLFAGHRVLFATAAYLPWLGGALYRALERGPRYLLFGAALSGLMLLCGNFQVVFIGMGALLGLVLLEALVGEPGQAIALRLRSAARAMLFWSVLLVSGVLIAAVQILPMFHTLGRSQRAEGGLAFASLYATEPSSWITYLLPHFFGNHVDAPFVAGWPYWESVAYLGILPIALLLVSPALLSFRRLLPPLLAIGVALVLSLGSRTPLFELYLQVVPGAELFRTASRFCLVGTLLGSLLAAQVFDAWLAGGRRRWLPALAPVLLLLAIGVGFCLDLGAPFGLGTSELLRASADPARLGALPLPERALLEDARWQALPSTLLLAGAALLLGLGLRWGRPPVLAAVLLVGLQLADLEHFGRRFLRTVPAAHLDWPAAVRDVLRAEHEPGMRVLPPPGLWFNHGAMHGIGSPVGYDTFLESRYARFLNRSQGRPAGHYFSIESAQRGGPLLALLGTRFLLSNRPLAAPTLASYGDFALLVRADGVHIYEDVDAVPRVSIVHAMEVVVSEIETLQRMEDPAFGRQPQALLEAPPPAGFPSPEARGNGPEWAKVERYEPNRVAIALEVGSAAILLLSDVFAPGWEARVDGEPAPLVPANRVMRAVPVAAGARQVEMHYRPPGLGAGGLVSGASVLGLAVCALSSRRPRSAGPA